MSTLVGHADAWDRPEDRPAEQTARPESVITDIPLRLDRLPFSRWHLRMATALGITFLLDGLEGGVGGSLSGALQSPLALHFSEKELGLTSTGYLFGTVVGALVFGFLADRFGRKSLFLWTLGVYVTATAATALSWNLWTFTLCRTLTGAGIGGEYTAITSAIDELIPARVRGTANLVIGSTFWIGVILGSLVAVGFLSDHVFGLALGWRMAFFSGVPLAVVVLIMRRHIPESPRWLLTHGREREANTVIDVIEGEVARQFGALAPVEGKVHLPRIHGNVFGRVGVLFGSRHRGRALLCMVLTIAQSFFYNSVFFSSTLVLLRFYGVSAAHAGVLFLPIALTNFIGPVLLSRLFDTVGRRIMIAFNFCITGVIFAISSFLFMHGQIGRVGQVAWWAAAFFFAASASGSAYLTTSELFPQQIRASAIAVFFGFGTLLGGVAGPAIYGILLSRGQRAPIYHGFLACSAVMIVAGIAQAIWGVAAERKPLEDIC